MLPGEGYIMMEDEVRLFYRKVGNGPQVIIIPNGFHMFDDFKRFADKRTLIFYDVRNRGFSDAVDDISMLARGVEQDVEDLDAVRRHFGLDEMGLIGHSYIGFMVALYAMKSPTHVNRIIQIGASQKETEGETRRKPARNFGPFCA
ncbi:alpha/beta hydrolase [bacterium]|nr:alpha/beta hydrolase [bacterium]